MTINNNTEIHFDMLLRLLLLVLLLLLYSSLSGRSVPVVYGVIVAAVPFAPVPGPVKIVTEFR